MRIALTLFAAMVFSASTLFAQVPTITALGTGPASALQEGQFNTNLELGLTYSFRYSTSGTVAGTVYRLEVSYDNKATWEAALRRNPQGGTSPVTVTDGGTNRGLGNLLFRPTKATVGATGFIRLISTTGNVIGSHETPFSIAPPAEPIAVDSTLSGSVAAGQRLVLSPGKIYGLDGYFFVDSLGVLEILPGTIIVGDTAGQNSAICVNRGGIIIAKGTADRPIVMTSRSTRGQRRSGNWGGLLIAGRARINQTGGEQAFEGGIADQVRSRGWYGGQDDNDSSGVLEYVRIEFAGIAAFPNEELNSLTMGGVGRRTVINNVIVSFGNDDGFEWFGGSVNSKRLISWGILDDDFDCDFGFSGKVQYTVSRRLPQVADQSTSQSFETDNDAQGSPATPLTSPIFSNVTAIGPITDTSSRDWSSLYGSAAQIRRNSRTSIVNSVFIGWPRAGMELRGARTQQAAVNDSILIRNNTFVGIKGVELLDRLETGEEKPVGMSATFLRNENWNNRFATQAGPIASYAQITDKFFSTGEDFNPVPVANATAWQGASFDRQGSSVAIDDQFFDRVDYRGAFAPGVTARWDLPWAVYDPNNFNYVAGGPVVSVEDEQGRPLPSLEVVDIKVYPNPAVNEALVRYNLPKSAQVTVAIYNAVGVQVATVLSNQFQAQGIYDFRFNVSNLAAGVYFVRVNAGDATAVQQLHVIR